jgi:hypothetical protein
MIEEKQQDSEVDQHCKLVEFFLQNSVYSYSLPYLGIGSLKRLRTTMITLWKEEWAYLELSISTRFVKQLS